MPPRNDTEIRHTASPLPEDFASGTVHSVVIPGIELGAIVGEGGMARVHEGLDRGFSPPRRVAVKLMSPLLSMDPEFRARFEREASIVADFRHDNVVHVYASGESEGEKYLVMEYLAGGTLVDRLDAGPLPLAEAMRIAGQLSDALAYSHARGIVHRDFKPGNVLFTADDKPVLSDFGVAKVTTSLEAGMTQHAAIIGAPRYMAPEQERGEPVTDRADVYSWGLTLYEMLTGEQPRVALRVLRSEAEAAELARHIPQAPPQLVRLIARCLVLDPGSRPSAAECAREIGAITISRDSPGLQSRASILSSGRPLGLIIGAGALLALVVSGAWFYYRGSDDPVVPALVVGQPVPDASVVSTVPLTVQRNPASASVFVDGVRLDGINDDVEVGVRRVVVIAPAYYGVARDLAIEEGRPQEFSISLSPIFLPDLEDHERFFNLADAATIFPEEIDQVSEPTLRTALRTKWLRQQGEFEQLESLGQEISDLSRFGDQRAPVARFLADSISAGRFRRDLVGSALLNSSEAGDALATFVIAVALRDELRGGDSPVSRDSPDFRAYCEKMALAGTQGWSDVTTPYLHRDGCDG